MYKSVSLREILCSQRAMSIVGHSLQIWNGLERDQREGSLVPMTLLCIFAAFGFILIVLLCWKILMEKLQEKDAAETPLSVEETCPHLGPFMPAYD